MPVRPLPADFASAGGGPASGGARQGRREPASQRLITGPGRIALGRAWQMGDSAGVLARHHPVEIAAVLALGVGGVVYPPIWLLGVLLAMTSRFWDLRDKWTGIFGPVMIVIFGTVAALMVGGSRSSLVGYAYEAWLAAGRIGRVAAALGAAYLLWRIFRGPREPKQPPWNQAHRLG